MSHRTCNFICGAILQMILAGGCVNPGLAARNPLLDPVYPVLPPPVVTTGAIYQVDQYSVLTSDQRARQLGDVLTVRLEERTQASKSASTDAARSSSTSLNLPETQPFASVPEALFAGGAQSSFKGNGKAAQENRLSGDISVTVARVLPNGMLMVQGRKSVRLNRGEELVEFSGIIRGLDIESDNTISSRRVADARIVYAGRGEIADQSRQGWFQRFFTKISPF
jgi:flagellar L-ring protein FlgH